MLASERGYFDVPRVVTVDELADDLGVSTTSVSERLRRGIDNLVDNTLRVDAPASADSVFDSR